MDLFLKILLPAVLGYLVGSFPTTYLLVRWRRRLDIRNEGTGNVGAMNAFEVTGSAKVGVAALVLDAVKGTAAVLVARWLFGEAFWIGGAAGIGATLGHIFSPWLGFKGGRGLSTAFGAAIVVGWISAVIWLALFGIVYALGRDLHGGSLAASIVMPGIVSLMPADLVRTLTPDVAHADLAWMSLAMCVSILLGHSKIILQLLKPLSPRQ